MPEKKYPAVPVIATILKIVAVIMLVFLVILAFYLLGDTIASWKGGAATNPFSPPPAAVTKFSERFRSLISPLFQVFQFMIYPFAAWLIGDIALALRDMEYNSRVRAGVVAQSAPVVQPTPPPSSAGPTDVTKTE